MDWLKSALGSEKKENKIDSFENELPKGMNFTTNEEDNHCLSCQDPCELGHPQIPLSMMNKINTTKEMQGTVKPYGIQLVLCSGVYDWEPKIEKTEGTFANAISKDLSKHKEGIPFKILLTAGSETPTETENQKESMDILIFPEMLRINSVHKEQLDNFITDQIAKKNFSDSRIFNKLPFKYYILICTHKKRDKRCGVVGPLLVEEFQNAIQQKGKEMEEQVRVLGVSHFGGHKFAGNVIIYPQGVWYGRVTPCHVEPILIKHILQGKIIKKLWRGTIHPN